MGAASSVKTSSIPDEQLIHNFIELYSSDPLKWDFIIAEGRKRYIENQSINKASLNKTLQSSNEVPYSTSFDVLALPEIAKTQYLEMFSEQIAVALNIARRNPAAFIRDHLERHLKKFVDSSIYEEIVVVTGDKTNREVKRRIQTKEGKTAVNEAIQYMKTITPDTLPILQSNVFLAKAALAHVSDIGATGSVEHVVSILLSCYI
jgi:hypothetical protein